MRLIYPYRLRQVDVNFVYIPYFLYITFFTLISYFFVVYM